MHTADSDSPSVQQLGRCNESGQPLVGSVDATKDAEIHSFDSSKPCRSEAWIRYCIEWRDLENRFKSRYEVTEHDFDISNLGRGSRLPAFERVAVFRTKSGTNAESSSESEGRGKNESLPTPGWSPTYYIRIYSVAIINALRSVVQYYPGQDLSGDSIEVVWPYPILVHHYNELHSFREAVAKKEPHEICVRERDIDKHLGLLFRFLDKEVMDIVKAEQERNNRDCCTFDYMWVALKPGRTVLFSTREGEEGAFEPGIIHSVSGGIFEHPRNQWTITLWSMAYNGLYLGRVERFLIWNKFDGEHTNLKQKLIFVCDKDLTEANKDERLRQAVEQGKTYWNLVSRQCRYHQGTTTSLPMNEVSRKI
jgi:hypothetical protein